MNRFLKRSAYHRQSAKPVSRINWQIILPYLNGTTGRVVLFVGILLAILLLLTQHHYFILSDVSIAGLDGYGREIAAEAIKSALAEKRLGMLSGESYFTAPLNKIDQKIGERLALEKITIEKKFPHTLIVNAAEIPFRSRVLALNGQALLSRQGEIVRWSNSTSTNLGPDLDLVIEYDQSIEQQQVLTKPLDPALLAALNKIEDGRKKFINNDLIKIKVAAPTLDLIELGFKEGTIVRLRASSDIETQLSKASIALNKYSNARSVDVRFGDKVFVSR